MEEKILTCLDWFYNECYLLSADGSWLSYYTGSNQLLEEYAALTQQKQGLLSKCNGFDATNKPFDGEISQNEYDKYFQDKTLPSSILTRIGINTGKMIVGNMGTDRKMNYTVMGNNVNIASRLEGVNKIYGTWIIASENTWNDANSGKNQGQLVARRLDKVRVMGIEQPIQLYNIIDFASELSNTELEAIDIFHRGLNLYLDLH